MVELIESKRSELRALCERYRVERLVLFGSALRDDFDSGNSDLDFCVKFQPMTPTCTPTRTSAFSKSWKNASRGG